MRRGGCGAAPKRRSGRLAGSSRPSPHLQRLSLPLTLPLPLPLTRFVKAQSDVKVPQAKEAVREGAKAAAVKAGEVKRVLSFGRRGKKASAAAVDEPATLDGAAAAPAAASDRSSKGGGGGGGVSKGGGGGPTCSELNITKKLDIKVSEP